MEILEILGFVGAFIVGLILGLIGSGGSILSVPILVYLFGLNPVTATAYSLFIVGITSLIGSIKNLKNKLIDYNTTLQKKYIKCKKISIKNLRCDFKVNGLNDTQIKLFFITM